MLEVETRIGGLSGNDIVLVGANVSRRHAIIVDSGFFIVDLASANGIKVQSKRIHLTVTLADRDRMRIGDDELIFEIENRQAKEA